MSRVKGSTREIVGSPQWPATETIEESEILDEADLVPSALDQTPPSADEQRWTRLPVAVFAALIYWPIIKPLDAILSNPVLFVLLLIVFLYGCLPFMITSGFLSSVLVGRETKIRPL
ncbi:hypothetical protein BGZ61DRAFT_533923 [Ilyonectria robusta]|uniref:uncharacterized protein n=1 Tax=Ilyonectria robusta TaxID=1079257 RepID=UPI001E8E3EDB|nr:uncharacterized protein BGZ61DRAFT_533923 [Ilyonectria robusta]KAH8686381.1 hypothetical protein BGZ61DRAFT_533923 [Ilyonectria robusta]